MKDRLIRLLENEGLSSSKFADMIGVQRSSVSHILSERNKPSFDFLQKTLQAFPGLNADWLILGEGDMYEESAVAGNADLFAGTGQDNAAELPGSGSDMGDSSSLVDDLSPNRGDNLTQTQNTGQISTSDKEIRDSVKRRVTRVILFYDDNSFASFDPES